MVKIAISLTIALCLLVTETTLLSLTHAWLLSPNILLPWITDLGIGAGVGLVYGASLSFIFGYLTDAFCGRPMGLHTFLYVALYLLVRGTGLRMLMRGAWTQVAACFAICLVFNGAFLALRGIFEPAPPFRTQSPWMILALVLSNSAITALFSPAIIALSKSLRAWNTNRQVESGFTP